MSYFFKIAKIIAIDTRAITPSCPKSVRIFAKFWYTPPIKAESGPNKTPKRSAAATKSNKTSVSLLKKLRVPLVVYGIGYNRFFFSTIEVSRKN